MQGGKVPAPVARHNSRRQGATGCQACGIESKNNGQDITSFHLWKMEEHLFNCGFSHHIVPGKDIYARSAVPHNPNQGQLFEQKGLMKK